ncbi:methyl-accepting chemotaxis protein [Neptunicella sp. SCSIO 80796]|uniref:methyl-accepting chemotaxis protein n=1 Tax=Neptunicella plasticusilytica TaxID=3117012 RepID=UPI003A4DE084
MNWQSIRVKSSLPIVLLAIALLITFLLLSQLLRMQEEALDAQASKFLSAISVVLNADRDLYQAKLAETHIIAKLGDVNEEKAALKENAEQVEQRFNQYRQYLSDWPDVARRFSDFEAEYSAWLKSSNQVVELSLNGGLNTSDPRIAESTRRFESLRSVLDKAGVAAESKSTEVQQELESDVATFKSISLVVLLILVAIAGWFSYAVPKKLTEQINFLTSRINEIASGEGDLTARIDVSSKDEFGELAVEFNNFVESLRELIKSILGQGHALGELTVTLAESAEKTQSVINSLTVASESIVSAVYEMNSSNKEMATIASTTAEEAQKSTEMSGEGIVVVDKSNRQISQLSSDMDKALDSSAQLQKNSGEIASVLDVIRGIAEQTNLLALNAAIEAARAGEQGRGFAVVADEVRTLATRTQESTNHIQTMIEQLTTSVNLSADAISSGKKNADQMVEMFQKANEVFTGIQQSSATVNDMSSQTALATNEQMQVSDAISQSLHQLNDQTTIASAVAESNDNLAKEIKGLSQRLNQLVGHFKV